MIKYIKTRNVKDPERKGRNAGIDLFIPEDTDWKELILTPNTSCNIPSGIKFKVPKGNCLIAFNKSGVASKYNLQVGACLIDENYTGEVHINLMNVGKTMVYLEKGQKILQLVLIKQEYLKLEKYNNEKDIFEEKDFEERGEGNFGSTG